MSVYLGMRIEVAARLYIVANLPTKYNNKNSSTRIFDVHNNGKISVEKSSGMLIARGVRQSKDRPKTNFVNFSIGVNLGDNIKDAKRIVKIVNVLGNDRLIKEKIDTFTSRQSALNSIPELDPLIAAFKQLDEYMPGFLKSAWYYAPEIIEK